MDIDRFGLSFFVPGRSAVMAKHGMVATSQPLAVQAGLDVLKRGGNAIDAAITANAVIGAVEPMSCGIGGDLFCIYHEAATGKLHGLNASGRSPRAISRQVFRDKGLSEIPLEGPLCWSVPGCVRGWENLHQRFGSWPWRDLLTPAIEYAEEGFPVSPVVRMRWDRSAAKLAKWPESARTFLPRGRSPHVAEAFRNPNLARSYRLIAEGGADAFYRGPIAQAVVACSQRIGGYFQMADLAEHANEWVQPVSTNYRGYDVWELPPNGQGIAVLQMLNLLEGYDLRKMGPASADYLHVLTEAKKLAWADRAMYYADPAFAELPVAELISKEYANERRGGIDMKRAATDVPAGDPRLARSETVYLSVVDKDRNCCSFIQSNYDGFGSFVVPESVGFPIQSRGSLFALDDHHLNRLEPGKRAFNTIIPAMVTKAGKPWFCFGVMGGDMQPQGQVQVLVNMLEFGMDVQEAGSAPRLYHGGSAEPTGAPAQPNGGTVHLEPGFKEEVIADLKARGHQIARSDFAWGGYQGIRIDHDNGCLHGGSETRNDGCAAGY